MRRKLRKFDHKTDHKIDYADHQHKASNDAACRGIATSKSAQKNAHFSQKRNATGSAKRNRYVMIDFL
ncbi:hypothetical protein GBS27_22200 [Escherichia coli]|nr:hypothetical protein [Escherichia coli]EGE4102598.1 hypothetical protein [Escherichia coli]NNQ67142.1 hypothetical protein [Escherichia coli]